MSLPEGPLAWAALLLGGVAPFFLFGALMDADWYWERDVNGLLIVRSSLHIGAYLYGASVLAWILVGRRAEGGCDRALAAWIAAALCYGLLTVPVPTLAGCIGLLDVFADDGRNARHAWLLLHPLGYAATVRLWMRTKSPTPVGVREVLLGLAPVAVLVLLQLALWRVEKRCFGILRRAPEDYVERLERLRPLAGVLNLDPLLMKYLRETGYLTPRSVPAQIEPTTELSQRIAVAWKLLRNEDIGASARARFVVLMRAKGHIVEQTAATLQTLRWSGRTLAACTASCFRASF